MIWILIVIFIMLIVVSWLMPREKSETFKDLLKIVLPIIILLFI